MLFVWILRFVSANLYCSPTQCTSCSQMYLYNSTSCINLCPTGYSLDSSQTNCLQTGSLTLFAIDCGSYSKFKSNSIESFSHPLGYSFNNPSRVTPVPIITQGLYFVETSLLESSKVWVPAPDFTVYIQILFRSTAGKIFRVLKGSVDILSIWADNNLIYAKWLVTNSTNQFYKQLSVQIGTTWINLIASSVQKVNSLSLKLNGQVAELPNCEFRNQEDGLKFILGDSS